mgnify:CR=1
YCLYEYMPKIGDLMDPDEEGFLYPNINRLYVTNAVYVNRFAPFMMGTELVVILINRWFMR